MLKTGNAPEKTMKIIKLFTGKDNHSHFEEIDTGPTTKEILGYYSHKFQVSEMMFRDFEPGAFFDWHNAPQCQYIVYLEGEVEVQTSSEKRVFKPGDVLFATDLTGKGHISKTLTYGKSLIIKQT
jgi:quercetin dioxygenase-like cupin family protein